MVPSRRVLWGALVLGTLLSLAVAYSIAKIWLLVGSEAGHSYYQYVLFFNPRSITLWLIAVAVTGRLLTLPELFVRRHEWLMVAAWIVVAFVLQGMLRSLTPWSFEQSFVSDGSNSFYGVTQRYDAVAVLSDFDRLRDEWPLHAHSNMPGKIIFVYALEYVTNNPAALAWLVVAVSNLGGVLLYLFVRELFADRTIAFFTLILYLFVPSKLYFLPLLNTVTPVVVFVCAWLLLRWLTRGKAVYPGVLGVALFGLVFFEPMALAIGLLFAVLVVRSLARREIGWQTLAWQTGLVGLSFAAVYAAMLVWLRFDLFHAMSVVGVTAMGFNDRYDRPYWLWVWANPLQFLFGVGVCQAVVFWAALGDSLRGPERWRDRLMRPMAALGLGLVGVLVAIDLIGVSRGEVVRLWIFLSCFFQVGAAYACARLQSRAALMLVLTTTLLQDVLGASMIGFIVP